MQLGHTPLQTINYVTRSRTSANNIPWGSMLIVSPSRLSSRKSSSLTNLTAHICRWSFHIMTMVSSRDWMRQNKVYIQSIFTGHSKCTSTKEKLSYYPRSKLNTKYSRSKLNTNYSRSELNTNYPRFKLNTNYPYSKLNTNYPQSKLDTNYPSL